MKSNICTECGLPISWNVKQGFEWKEKAEKYDKFNDLIQALTESNKNFFEENKRLKEFVDRVKRFREEYEDIVRERQRDSNYQGWCNESIRLGMLNEILQIFEVDGQ